MMLIRFLPRFLLWNSQKQVSILVNFGTKANMARRYCNKNQNARTWKKTQNAEEPTSFRSCRKLRQPLERMSRTGFAGVVATEPKLLCRLTSERERSLVDGELQKSSRQNCQLTLYRL